MGANSKYVTCDSPYIIEINITVFSRLTSVMASTPDSDSGNSGSIPESTFSFLFFLFLFFSIAFGFSRIWHDRHAVF